MNDESSSIGDPDEHERKTRLRRGDPEVLNELLKSHWSPLVAYSTGLVGRRDIAEEIVQESFLRVWQRRSEWSPTGSVRSLLYRICRNLALNERRSSEVRRRSRDQVQVTASDEEHCRTPLELLEHDELRLAIDRAIAKLSPRRREVFILRQLHGLSLQETAAVMGIAVQTVKNQMGAAIADLRKMLAPMLD